MAGSPHFAPLLRIKQQLQRLIWRVQQRPDHHLLYCQLRPILLRRNSMPQTSRPLPVTGIEATCERVCLLCLVGCGSSASVGRLGVSQCLWRLEPHSDAAKQGVRHAQQVWPALHHAGHYVRQGCPLRHCSAAPAQATMLHEKHSSSKRQQRYGASVPMCSVLFLVLLLPG